MSDLISRKAVLKGISLSCTGQSDVIKAEAALVRYVKKIPSAEPERKLGRWLWGGEWDDGRNKLVRCSICNAADIQAAGVIVPYCWHCGAEMEVQDE